MRETRRRKMRRFSSWLFSLLITFFLIGVIPLLSSSAEIPYPDKPINMIVAYAPGGGADLGSKVVADKIAKLLGQPLISVYKPGGGGSLGAAFVAKGKPDGHTILVGNSTILAVQPNIKKIDYKLDDFVLVGIYGKIPLWLAVKADAKWKTLKEFVEEERKFPGKLQVGSFGKLTTADFVIELLNRYAGFKLTHVPYKSSSEALTSVLGGHIEAAIVSGGGGLLESGQIRILAVAEEERLEDLPDVPTFKEFGYPIELSGWFSFCFPKGTPNAIVDKFSKAQEKAIKRYSKEIKKGLREVEIWAEFLNPEDSVKYCKKQSELIFEIATNLGLVAK